MQRIIIIAKGDVQRVGYRDTVERIARKLGLVGYVENLKPYDVRVLAEGEKEQLESFIEKIKITDDPLINVEDVVVTYEKPTGEFNYFEIRRGPYEEENAERLDVAAEHLKGLTKAVKTMDVNLGGKIDNVADKQDRMLEKQDQMLDKQDQTIEILGGKIDNGFENLGSKIDTGFENLGSKIDNGFTKIDNDFTVLRSDYGKISQTMEKILESMNDTSKKTEKILEVLTKQQQDFTQAINALTGAILKLAEKR